MSSWQYAQVKAGQATTRDPESTDVRMPDDNGWKNEEHPVHTVLNRLGKEGWKVVTAVYDPEVGQIVYTLERQPPGFR
jgi:hypothetical protein